MTQTVILLPVMIVTVVGMSIVAIVALNLRFKSRKLEHDEVVKAIEAGQELPEIHIKKKEFDHMKDMRNGIMWLASGLGAFLLFRMGDLQMQEMSGLGFIPIFIGMGLIAISLIVKYQEEKSEGK